MTDLKQEHEKQHLDALLARLRAGKPGETYRLDPYERYLLLGEIERLQAEIDALKEAADELDTQAWLAGTDG